MKPKILLVTTVPYSPAARMAGAFSSLGAQVEAVFPRGHVLAVSRYVDRTHRYRPLDGEASLAAAIRTCEPDHLVCCDDRAIALLTGLAEFAPLFERVLGPRDSYRLLLTRTPSIAAARVQGIAAPLTQTVDSLEALPEALHAVGLPCVMKADASWGGSGVRFVCSIDEARKAFVKLQGPPSRLRSLVRVVRRHDLHFLEAARNPRKATVNVQALIPGKPATSVFAAKEGKVLAAQHMDVVSWAGDAGPAKVMARVSDPRMDEAAAKIAAVFHLSGLHGLDFVRDADGVAHLIEVNPRATQICHLPLDADLAAALIGVPARPAVTDLKRIALFPQLLGGETPPQVYRDIPWDDPRVLRALSGEALPEAAGLEAIAEFDRPRALHGSAGADR
jgi:predicted ATP-grasp superfamily ATP-dependent carboligase